MKRLWMIPALLGLLPMLSRADINITEGSGKVVPTDTVSGKEYQKIKIVDGTTGGISPAPVDPVGGLSVRLATGTALAGQFQVTQSTLQVQQSGTASVSAAQSGTWTVQPGNTANTTSWLVQMSTMGVNGSTVAVVNAGGIALKVDGSAVTQPVQVLISTLQVQTNGTGSVQVLTSTLQVQQSGTASVQVVTSTLQVQINGTPTVTANAGTGNFNTIGPVQILTVTGSTATVGYQGTISSVPVSIQGTASVQVLTSTLQVQQSGTLSAQVVTSTLQVQMNGTGSVQVVTSTLQVQQSGTASVQVVTSTEQVQISGGVGGFAASGAAASGNPMQVGVRVTSTTVPTAASDGQEIYQASDNMGRTLVSGMPWGVISSTYSTVMSSNGVLGGNFIGGQILVSSAGASTRTYLCGCTFTNTTATTNEAVIMSPPGLIGAITKTHLIGIPASFVPSGYRHDCGNPFFASAINSNIGIYQSQTAGATAAIHYACSYFQGP